jgi:cap1 methyltransferase
MASSCVDDPQRKRVRHHLDDGAHHRQVDKGVTDCYEEVANDGIFEDQDGSLRQSWLLRQRWFSEYQPIHKGTVAERAGEIQSLQRQLIEIKRRLLPAAQNAAEAYNAYIDQMDDLPELSPQEVFQKARRACNPIEVLGEGRAGGLNNLFVNRSAIKLANINASLGFVLTWAADEGSFHFVDLCAAPGGFSEYLFHHCGKCYPTTASIRGFGMSLMGTNEHGRGTEWKVDNYDSQNMQYRICTGADGTGDIYNWDNVMTLAREIDGQAIHAVVCDGGVDAQRDHEHQEQLAQKLVICQAAAVLSILGPGGCMVVKLFGCQTDAIRTMLKDLALRFQDFTLTKPISSRPASAERYLVLVGFQGVSPEFDGRKWRDTIFLGRPIGGPSTDKDEKLESYLDVLDRDMMLLNIKTCFAILSKMERMVRHLEENEEACDNQVDIQAYKLAWRL